eukprot:EG_transcript_8395
MDVLQGVRAEFNGRCSGVEPLKLVAGSVVTAFLLHRFLKFSTSGTALEDSRATFFRLVTKLPMVQKKLREEQQAFSEQTLAMFAPASKVGNTYAALPPTSVSVEDICNEVDALVALNQPYDQGQQSGAVYNDNPVLLRLFLTVHEKFHWSNPIHFSTYPGIQKMETEVVSMTVAMYNGDSQCCGVTTSGGTESILMAMKTYREWAHDKFGITEPNVVLPASAHPAFIKAAHYFKIRLIIVPVDGDTGRVVVKKVRSAINRNTIAIVGSSPSYPHGSVDDIAALSEIAVKYRVGLHVDCCMGGFLAPFMEDAGFRFSPVDFRLPGVTSISCDHHKYGFAPKGSSAVLYRSRELRKYQFFTYSGWPGGLYCSPGIAGSRPGNIIAETWATMLYHGKAGYVESTKKIVGVREAITNGLKQIKGLRVLGRPQLSIIAFTSDDFDIYVMAERLEKCGWYLHPLQFPSAVHLCCTMQHTKPGVVQRFLEDCKREAAELLRNPTPPTGATALYGSTQKVPDRSMVDGVLQYLWDSYYTLQPAQIKN